MNKLNTIKKQKTIKDHYRNFQQLFGRFQFQQLTNKKILKCVRQLPMRASVEAPGLRDRLIWEKFWTLNVHLILDGGSRPHLVLYAYKIPLSKNVRALFLDRY